MYNDLPDARGKPPSISEAMLCYATIKKDLHMNLLLTIISAPFAQAAPVFYLSVKIRDKSKQIW